MPKNLKVGISLGSTWFLSDGPMPTIMITPTILLVRMIPSVNKCKGFDCVMGTHVNGMPWGDSPVEGLPMLQNYLEK